MDVEAFRKKVLYSSREDERKDIILTVCRIHKSKEIENTIRLAKHLKEKKSRGWHKGCWKYKLRVRLELLFESEENGAGL